VGQLVGVGELAAAGTDEARDTLIGFFGSASVRLPQEALEGAADLALTASPGFLRGAIQSVADTRPGDAISEVGTPTLVISGSADAFLPACIEASQRLPNAALHVFNRVGHMPPAEVPEELAALIDDFAQHGVVAPVMAG
jgi:pimeloyl-ACP methyl ester carboxylesterase